MQILHIEFCWLFLWLLHQQQSFSKLNLLKSYMPNYYDGKKRLIDLTTISSEVLDKIDYEV
jgi:hypothetical protein